MNSSATTHMSTHMSKVDTSLKAAEIIVRLGESSRIEIRWSQ